MCGIYGMVDIKGRNPIDREFVENAVSTIRHRGPDDSGYYFDRNMAFGFARLSIIDLKLGKQPLENEDGSVILVCNGEIYNYKELKKELVERGHSFQTEVDVEVILHLYEEYSEHCVNYLNGQFAFAIYDRKMNRVVIARDYAGIAPLFYTTVNGRFIFSSEIKAILADKEVKRQPELTALDQILTFPGLISPYTMFKNIYSLEAGHYLVIDSDGVSNHEYWDLIYPTEDEARYVNQLKEQDYIEQLDASLTKAVKYRLNAEVPVGFYISGGLDSSLIAAKIKQVNQEIIRHSFSVDFNKVELSESKYQHLMREYVNSIHHEKLIGIKEIAKYLPSVIYHCECALKESYNTASFMLSEMARQENIKVVLTGEGADELFGGYIGYRFDKLATQNQKTNFSDMERAIRQRLWGNDRMLYEKHYSEFTNVKKQLFSKQIQENYDEIDCTNHFVFHKDRLKGRSIFHQRSYIDFKLRMGDHLLSDHGDRMAYGNSVEARYPFLDKEFIECSIKIPEHLKLNGFNEKYILKEVAKGLVPNAILSRPKFAFAAPGSQDLLKQDVEYVNHLLSRETIEKQGYFDYEKISQLKQEYLREGFKLNVPYDNDLLITVITFGIWMEQFKVENY